MRTRPYPQAAVAALIAIGLASGAANAASAAAASSADGQGTGASGGSATGGTAAGSAGSGAEPGATGAGAGSGTAGSGAAGGTSPRPVGPAAWLGRTVRLTGNLGPGAAGQPVVVERLSPAQGRWVVTARTRADRQGGFTVFWRATETGHLAFRARVPNLRAGSAQADPSTAAGQPIGVVAVYRADLATWYGPGSYGHKTACGEQMTHQLLGVASRTLPCGTMVELSYRGAALAVPVVDRGPYSHARWDLTYATAQALDFSGAGRIGTLVAARP